MTAGASGAAAFRGQPLLLLGGLLLGWSCLRMAVWQASWEEALQAAPLEAVASPRRAIAGQTGRHSATSRTSMQMPRLAKAPAPARPPRYHAPPSNLLLAVETLGAKAVSAGTRRPSVPLPGIPSAAPPVATAGPAAWPKPPGRWSADGWLLLRGDSATPAAAAGPSYGRSQVGAVLRYDLAPESDRRPSAYLRTSSALAGARERQFAAGLSFRPLREIPLRVAAEARVVETTAGTSLAPAVHAISELPRISLPLDLRGEAYLQGGYVAGRYETAFVDGQARVEKPLASIGAGELSVAGGAWGGAQEGSARLDAGPSVAAVVPLGKAYGRLAIDYRFRVAGDAAPASGLALTLSAGF